MRVLVLAMLFLLLLPFFAKASDNSENLKFIKNYVVSPSVTSLKFTQDGKTEDGKKCSVYVDISKWHLMLEVIVGADNVSFAAMNSEKYSQQLTILDSDEGRVEASQTSRWQDERDDHVSNDHIILNVRETPETPSQNLASVEISSQETIAWTKDSSGNLVPDFSKAAAKKTLSCILK